MEEWLLATDKVCQALDLPRENISSILKLACTKKFGSE